MTAMQHLSSNIFNLGPAIILGIYKQWWVGLVALIATFVLAWGLVFLVTTNLTGNPLTFESLMKKATDFGRVAVSVLCVILGISSTFSQVDGW